MWTWFKDTLQTPDGLRTAFILLSVATLLTMYEITTFYKIITPELQKQIDRGIDSLGIESRRMVSSKLSTKLEPLRSNLKQKSELNDTLQVKLDSFSKKDDSFNNLLSVFDEREQILTGSVNDYTKATGVLILVVLIGLLLVIKLVLNSQGHSIGVPTFVNIGVKLILIA